MSDFLSADIKFIKGVGEARAKMLRNRLEISTVRDMLYNFPYKHVDKSHIYKIADFKGEMPAVQIAGHFISFSIQGEGSRARLVGIFSDGKSLIEVLWFRNFKNIERMYQRGVEYILFGKPTLFRNSYSLAHPEITTYDKLNPPTGFHGLYSIPENVKKSGFASRTLSTIVSNIFEAPQYKNIIDPLPAELIQMLNLMPIGEALRNMHFPKNPEDYRRARERMKFEELFFLELNILRYSRKRSKAIAGYPFLHIGDYFNNFYHNHIPFSLTEAQKRVLREIREDMRYGRQMNRLLQGDVGSGKTMVAFMAMLMAADNDCQAALMAPTEILATQHYETISGWAEKIGLKVALLIGSTRTSQRRVIHEQLLSGEIQFLIGTHALIEDTVKFKKLGLAVIDEQHRFGVAQRAKLWKKNSIAPHMLVMTATPIPRTLAMTVYGDLEVSVIDQLPPGRKPVQTFLRYDDARKELNALIRRELDAGHQIYIVYPLITENPNLELRSVEEGHERVRKLFPDVKVSCVHGKLKPMEKDAQMQLFVSGETRIMVATTVIEVGVNVPNASVMVIENAERFGLSQLHQLRGRVGRGADHSYCILVTKNTGSADTKKRLAIMTETSDGFLISEADMKMRGPGDMEGTQQSGLAFNLHVANLATDGQIISRARDVATRILNAHPELGAPLPPETGELPVIRLSQDSLGILMRELSRRFAHTVDWSRIS